MTQTNAFYRQRPGNPAPARRAAQPMFGNASGPTQTPQTQPQAVPMFGGPVVVPAGSKPTVLASALQSFRAPVPLASTPVEPTIHKRHRGRTFCAT